MTEWQLFNPVTNPLADKYGPLPEAAGFGDSTFDPFPPKHSPAMQARVDRFKATGVWEAGNK